MLKEIPVTGMSTFVTVTVNEACLLLPSVDLAVMVAFPAAFAVTTPLFETDATVEFDGKNISFSGLDTAWIPNVANTANWGNQCKVAVRVTKIELISIEML